MTDTATPRPWSFDTDERSEGYTSNLYDGNDLLFGETFGPNGKANAALIVRAVNHHNELVTALEGLLTDMEELFAAPDQLRMAAEMAEMERPLTFGDDGPDTIKRCRAILAKISEAPS